MKDELNLEGGLNADNSTGACAGYAVSNSTTTKASWVLIGLGMTVISLVCGGCKSTGTAQQNGALISADSRFAECTVKELEFQKQHAGKYIAQVVDEDCSLNDITCKNDSEYRYQSVLKLLRKGAYIDRAEPYYLSSSSVFSGLTSENQIPSGFAWRPNQKGLATLGNDIREEKTAHGSGAYKWTLYLGCRKFQQIDATTPLADGAKVDFSWQWKPTDLGFLDGLTEERQRGVAYLTRSSTGLVVDQIQIDSDKSE